MKFPKIIMDTLTNSDGITFCHAKVSGAGVTFFYCIMAMINTIINHKFDEVAFAMGYTAILSSICTGVRIKKDTESS